LGYTVPNNDNFPAILEPSYGFDINYTPKRWKPSELVPAYKRLSVSYRAVFQSLGNKEFIGRSYGTNMTVNWRYRNVELSAGLGAAYLDTPFDKLSNPLNRAIGSHLNFFGYAGAIRWFPIKNSVWQIGGGINVTHFSNANLSTPNLGVNIPSLQIGLRYTKKQPFVEEQKVYEKLNPNLKRLMFLGRTSLGLVEKGIDGGKYAVSTASVGFSKRVGYANQLRMGVEYIFDSRTYYFLKHLSLYPDNRTQAASRYLVWLSHEFLFNHWGFLTEGGVYLKKHYGQRSIFSTKLGINFYPYQKLTAHKPYIPYIGWNVRAYFGDVDFSEIVLGWDF
jgi:hypothetical protein